VNLAKVPFSVGLGLITPELLLVDLVLFPAVLMEALVGRQLVRRIDQRQFETAALALTLLAAAFLVV